MATWYERGFRPAIEKLLPTFAAEWPATYRTEEIRAGNVGSWGRRSINRDIVQGLMHDVHLQALIDPDDALDWAMDAFVMHTVRGTKLVSFHPTAAGPAAEYLDTFIRDAKIVGNAFDRGEWYIDVGIQISSKEEMCVQWTTASHHRIVEQALRIPERDAQRITEINSSKYTRDLASHLTAVSGFRIKPGPRAAGRFQVCYLQAYTTDKTVTYHPKGKHFALHLTSAEALGKHQPTTTVDGIHSIYEGATTANHSSARLEARVPVQFATTVLTQFEHEVMRGCLCLFTKKEWWCVVFNPLS